MSITDHQLNTLREKIDAIDAQLVHLLNERAAISVQIGQAKKSHPSFAHGIQDHQREELIFSNITNHNTGPLSHDQLLELFQSILSHSRQLQGMDS